MYTIMCFCTVRLEDDLTMSGLGHWDYDRNVIGNNSKKKRGQ